MNTFAAANRPKPRGSFYTWVAVCIFLIIFAGFARTYYLKTLFGTPALPLLLHLHGLIFTLWFALFFIQVRLVARHRVDLHRRLGIFGAVLAPLAACVAIAVSFHAGRRIYRTSPASLTVLRARPFALDFGSSLTFVLLVAARRHPQALNGSRVLRPASSGYGTASRSYSAAFPSRRRRVGDGRLHRNHAGCVHPVRHHKTSAFASCVCMGRRGAFVVSTRIHGDRQHERLAQLYEVVAEPMTEEVTELQFQESLVDEWCSVLAIGRAELSAKK